MSYGSGCCPNCGSRNICGTVYPNVIECDSCGYKGYVDESTYRSSRQGLD